MQQECPVRVSHKSGGRELEGNWGKKWGQGTWDRELETGDLGQGDGNWGSKLGHGTCGDRDLGQGTGGQGTGGSKLATGNWGHQTGDWDRELGQGEESCTKESQMIRDFPDYRRVWPV